MSFTDGMRCRAPYAAARWSACTGRGTATPRRTPEVVVLPLAGRHARHQQTLVGGLPGRRRHGSVGPPGRRGTWTRRRGVHHRRLRRRRIGSRRGCRRTAVPRGHCAVPAGEGDDSRDQDGHDHADQERDDRSLRPVEAGVSPTERGVTHEPIKDPRMPSTMVMMTPMLCLPGMMRRASAPTIRSDDARSH